jgi:transcriptional regulator with XRE-family HTH domain
MTKKRGTDNALGNRIRRLRQERGWSQAQLAMKLKIHQKQVSGYERDVHAPSTDLLIRVATLFDVSLDYLAFDDRNDARRVTVADRELLEKLEELDRLPEGDRATVKAVLDTFILKRRLQGLAESAAGR